MEGSTREQIPSHENYRERSESIENRASLNRALFEISLEFYLLVLRPKFGGHFKVWDVCRD